MIQPCLIIHAVSDLQEHAEILGAQMKLLLRSAEVEALIWSECPSGTCVGAEGVRRVAEPAETGPVSSRRPETRPTPRRVVSQMCAGGCISLAPIVTLLARSNSVSHRAADSDEFGRCLVSARPHR